MKIERNTHVFVEIDANKVTDEFLKEFATEVLSGGYIPGFYVDTDSYNNFDRLFSRAYQANEELMKQCKIWALSPEMEEFYETKNGHNEKPNIWGPFAPSCISKEQISFWQYGRKCHPIIPESIVKNVGDQYFTLENVNGEPSLAYYKDTIYQNGYYATAIAIWDVSPDLSNSTTHTNKRVVTLEFKKAYNVFTYYYPNSNEIHVLFSDDNSSYIMNKHTQISIKLTGCQTAYIENCSFEMSLGGSNGSNNSWVLERLLGLLGEPVSNLLDVYSFLSDSIHAISNYMFDKAKNEYMLYPECNLVTKQVGSTFKSAVNKKYALLKVRAILNNVTVYPTSKVFCQAQTMVTRLSGTKRCVYFGGSIPLE